MGAHGPATLYWKYPQNSGQENGLYQGSSLPPTNPAACISFRPRPLPSVPVESGASLSVGGNPYFLSFASYAGSEAVNVSTRQPCEFSPDIPVVPPAGGGCVVVNKQRLSAHSPSIKQFVSAPRQPAQHSSSSPAATPHSTDYVPSGGCFLRPVNAAGQAPVGQRSQPYSTAQTTLVANSGDVHPVHLRGLSPLPIGTVVQEPSPTSTAPRDIPPADSPGFSGIFPAALASAQPRLSSAPEVFSVHDPRTSVDATRAGWEASPLRSEGGFTFSSPFLTPQSFCGDEGRVSTPSLPHVPPVQFVNDRCLEVGNPGQVAETVYFTSPTLATPSLTANTLVAGSPAGVSSPGAPRRLAHSPSPPTPQISRDAPPVLGLPATLTPQRPRAFSTFEHTHLWAPQHPREDAQFGSRGQGGCAPEPARSVSTAYASLGQGFASGSSWPAEGQNVRGSSAPSPFSSSQCTPRADPLSAPSSSSIQKPTGALWVTAASGPQDRQPLLPQAGLLNSGPADLQDQLNPEERHRLRTVQHLVRQTQELIADTERRLSTGWRTLEGAGLLQSPDTSAADGHRGNQIVREGDYYQEGRSASKAGAPGTLWAETPSVPAGPNNHAGTWHPPTNALESDSRSTRQTLGECLGDQSRRSQGAERIQWCTGSQRGGEVAEIQGDTPSFHPETRFADQLPSGHALDRTEATAQRSKWVQESLASVEPTGDRLQSRSCRGREEGSASRGETRSGSVATSVASGEFIKLAVTAACGGRFRETHRSLAKTSGSAGSASGAAQHSSQGSSASSRLFGHEGKQLGLRTGERPDARRENGRGPQNPPEPLRRGGAPIENMGVSIAARRAPSDHTAEACVSERTTVGKRGTLREDQSGYPARRDIGGSGESDHGEKKRGGLERRVRARDGLHAANSGREQPLWKREETWPESGRGESRCRVQAAFGVATKRGENPGDERGSDASLSRELSQSSLSPEARQDGSGARRRRPLAPERRPQMQRFASRSLSRRCLSEEGTVDATMEDLSQSHSASGPLRHPPKPLRNPLASSRRGLATGARSARSPSVASSASSPRSRKGVSEERTGPGAATGKRKPLGSHSSVGSAGAVRYRTHEDLQPFDEPPCLKTIEETILPRLGVEVTKGDWTEQIETLDTVRRLAKFHFASLTQDVLRQALAGILAWLASPRSTVAKNACLTLSDLFFFGKRRMDPWVLEVVELCMKKCCQSNEFLNEAVRSVLSTVCQFASESRVLHAFLHCIPPCKQPGARSTAASCLALLFQRTSEQAARGGELAQIVKLLSNMATEASPDVRVAARVALTMLHRTFDGATLRRVCGSLDARTKMEGFVSRTTNREIEDVLKTVEAGPPGGGRTSLASSLSSIPDDSRSAGRGQSGSNGGYRPFSLGPVKP
ncbi:conserved hypothetical protein [Neospora caninum Liverpool]|uniref:CLASP N-terminal domain-containing protein n=1 Tax=Neospora caninum (strain Liverpool) TaxID=572307 RepID=F0VN90_NEOCL|nr:conserved hypothetical protein [Neospora caninum Liverpool]CBZ55186.1 conserved hypothetical protein [Neospora caninum Liverpool]|eukprot:XP_003885214.1 conserved hypothetical protein [Neospora caninum Liverpool]